MNTAENTPTPPASAESDLRSQRVLVNAIAISLFILIGTVFLFLYRQVVLVRKQTAELMQVIEDYQRSNTPEMISQMGVRFGEFAREHKDFEPIYLRYYGTNSPAPASPAAAQSQP